MTLEVTLGNPMHLSRGEQLTEEIPGSGDAIHSTRYGARWKICGRNWTISSRQLLRVTSSSSRGEAGNRILPSIRGEFRIEVREQDNEVIVVADLPGIEKEDVSQQLINPMALEISCRRNKETEGKTEGYFVRERVSGTMRRIISLPVNVTEDKAKVSFRNGVLEITLPVAKESPKTRIVIE
jgi:HSP20 family protein